MNKFVKGLSFKTQFAIDYAAKYNLQYDNKYAVFIPTWSNYNSKDIIVGITQQNDEIVTGNMTMDNASTNYRQTISWNGHFDYDHTFGGKHHVTGMLLANMFTTTSSGQYHRYANANLGLQAGYDFMGRYFADVTLAGVHSARLPEGNRNALSRSFTIGWNMAKESFMEGSRINDLMLSASYSNLSEDIDVYMGDKYFYLYEPQWETGNGSFVWNESTSTNITYSTSGSNPALDFIHRKEFSVSLRGSFFDRLLSTELTFFNTNLDGFIIQNPTSFPSYLQSGLVSQAKFKPAINNNIQNRKGLDFSISAQKQFGDVYAALGFVGTIYDTNWKKYDEVREYDYQNYEGRPIDVIWGYNCLGFYAEDEFDKNATTGKLTLKNDLPKSKIGGTVQPGDLKYEDVNADGVIDSKDMINLGKDGRYGSPFTMGLNLTLKYKNFTLFLIGNGQFGAYGLKTNLGNYYYMSGDNKYSVNALGRWTSETADVATHPRLSTQSSAHNAAASTFWLYSTNRFNLRKVQLTYDFPKSMMGKVVKDLSIYLNANDLLTIAKERKLMETNIGSAPQTRFYNLGVKATF